MKVNELMIGDWVSYQGNYNRVYRILPATVPFADIGRAKEDLLHIVWNNVHDQVRIDDIEPIPLTPDILLKNGFKQTDKGDNTCIIGEYAWGAEGKRNFTVVTITFYKGLSSGVKLLTKIETDCSYESGINQVHNCDIEYVHQFQHALRLCGSDKEIIL